MRAQQERGLRDRETETEQTEVEEGRAAEKLARCQSSRLLHLLRD
jgi:hypothetical protein